MYKVIIVDDEQAARDGFLMYVNTMKSDFTVVQTFEDGKDAIEFLAQNDIDIVITDIRMLETSGIEVAKYVYENKPATRVILTSAYKDFEYAYSAVEYKVSKILIKPVSYRDFSQALTRASAEIASKTEECSYCINKYICELPKVVEIADYAVTAELVFYTEKMFELAEGKWNYGKKGFSKLIKNFLNDCFSGNVGFEELEPGEGELRFLAYSETVSDDNSFKTLLKDGIKKAIDMLSQELSGSSDLYNGPKTAEDAPTNDVTDRTKQYVEKHYSEDISLYDLGTFFNVNNAYLSRIFKQRVGMGFSSYLTHVRIENAKKFILEGKYKIEDVAKMVGYPNASYFNKVFKNCTGYTPRAFYLQEVVKKDEK